MRAFDVFVLGADGENHAPPAQVEKESLQRNVRFAHGAVLAKRYAIQTVIANDASP